MNLDTVSPYLALAEKDLENCMGPEMKAEWERLHSKDCTACFTADSSGRFIPERVMISSKYMTSDGQVFSKRSLRVRECCVLVVEPSTDTTKTFEKLQFSSKCLDSRIIFQSDVSLLQRYRKVFDVAVRNTSANRGFRTKDHTVAVYEQAEQRISFLS